MVKSYVIIIPSFVFRSGPNKWRDSLTPKQILEEYCKKNNIPGPFYFGTNKLTMDSKMFNLADFGKLTIAHWGIAVYSIK